MTARERPGDADLYATGRDDGPSACVLRRRAACVRNCRWSSSSTLLHLLRPHLAYGDRLRARGARRSLGDALAFSLVRALPHRRSAAAQSTSSPTPPRRACRRREQCYARRARRRLGRGPSRTSAAASAASSQRSSSRRAATTRARGGDAVGRRRAAGRRSSTTAACARAARRELRAAHGLVERPASADGLRAAETFTSSPGRARARCQPAQGRGLGQPDRPLGLPVQGACLRSPREKAGEASSSSSKRRRPLAAGDEKRVLLRERRLLRPRLIPLSRGWWRSAPTQSVWFGSGDASAAPRPSRSSQAPLVELHPLRAASQYVSLCRPARLGGGMRAASPRKRRSSCSQRKRAERAVRVASFERVRARRRTRGHGASPAAAEKSGAHEPSSARASIARSAKTRAVRRLIHRAASSVVVEQVARTIWIRHSRLALRWLRIEHPLIAAGAVGALVGALLMARSRRPAASAGGDEDAAPSSMELLKRFVAALAASARRRSRSRPAAPTSSASTPTTPRVSCSRSASTSTCTSSSARARGGDRGVSEGGPRRVGRDRPRRRGARARGRRGLRPADPARVPALLRRALRVDARGARARAPTRARSSGSSDARALPRRPLAMEPTARSIPSSFDAYLTSTVPRGGGVSSSSALTVACTIAARRRATRSSRSGSAPTARTPHGGCGGGRRARAGGGAPGARARARAARGLADPPVSRLPRTPLPQANGASPACRAGSWSVHEHALPRVPTSARPLASRRARARASPARDAAAPHAAGRRRRRANGSRTAGSGRCAPRSTTCPCRATEVPHPTRTSRTRSPTRRTRSAHLRPRRGRDARALARARRASRACARTSGVSLSGPS